MAPRVETPDPRALIPFLLAAVAEPAEFEPVPSWKRGPLRERAYDLLEQFGWGWFRNVARRPDGYYNNVYSALAGQPGEMAGSVTLVVTPGSTSAAIYLPAADDPTTHGDDPDGFVGLASLIAELERLLQVGE